MYLKLLLAFMMLLSLNGCKQVKQEEKQTNQVMVVNPLVSYDSLEAINNELKVDIELNTKLELLDISYTIINKEIAQVKFNYQDYNYCIRASHATSGIALSGMYGNYEEYDIDEYHIYESDNDTVITFEKNNVNYSISVNYLVEDINEILSLINL